MNIYIKRFLIGYFFSIFCIWACLHLFGLLHLTKALEFCLQFATAFSNGQGNEYFYASLYAGLYHEAQVCPQHVNIASFLSGF